MPSKWSSNLGWASTMSMGSLWFRSDIGAAGTIQERYLSKVSRSNFLPTSSLKFNESMMWL
jgi:hypothetical protein